MASAIVETQLEIPMSDDQLKANSPSIPLRKPYGSTDLISTKTPPHHGRHSKDTKWWVVLNLAFQSIGIVYGDLGTSPLYIYSSTFSNGIKHKDDVLGVLSLVFYTLTLLPLIKYVFIVLRATDNGEGGTFALYSLICRYAKVSLIPSQQAEDRRVSNYTLELPSKRLKLASVLKSSLENSKFAKLFLLLITMLGTSMVIGDSILTPSISDMIAGISIVILVFLFMIQRFGTSKVGYTFAPILSLWFILIGGIGFYNIIKHDTTVLKAINPIYIVEYFIRNKKDAWVSLGGVVLCTTGPMYWPMFVVSILASVIASQAMISGTFSVVHQSLSLGCFPRVKVVHTSANHEGQVYIPEINYFLMLACVGVTFRFQDHWIEVVFVMTLTSALLVLIMIMIWKTNIFLIILYIVTIGFVELLYLSSVLYKFTLGGYLPLAFSAFLMIIMYVWNNVYRRKYHYELDHMISPARLIEIFTNKNMARIPGIAVFYSELVQGIPPIFEHYVSNVPALHSIIVFVSVKSLHVNRVPAEERYFFRRVEPRKLFAFQCAVRYGYNDVREVATLITRLKEFIQEETWMQIQTLSIRGKMYETGRELDREIEHNEIWKEKQAKEEKLREIMEQEIEQVKKAWEEVGIVHLVGQNEVIASKESNMMKRILVDYAYNLLRRNLRQREAVFDIPHKRMLKVGMTYQL
ncbi:hypothetical protein GOBAR_AA22180 [Gossypium barbadense]|uniref:Potassium transporter n=1 Tax=Gossypium barbadense TaxID=3634 RepID=A0A2P5X561_GOSBA|nr:hypothetical protein GOBAR_AA22180 [Gossypium barbadense]